MFGFKGFAASGWQDDGIRAIYRRLPLFQNLSRKALRELTDELTWFSLPAGRVLFKEGADGDALFVLVSGMLAITTTDRNGRLRRIGNVHVGETVGELAMLARGPRSATVTALRDSTLLGLDQAAFDRMLERHPHTANTLLHLLAVRQLRMMDPKGTARHAGTTALISLDPELDCATFAAELAARLVRLDPPAPTLQPTKLLTAGTTGFTEDHFHELETLHARLIYCAQRQDNGRAVDPAWARRCYRQADHIILLARPETRLPPDLHGELSRRRDEPRPHDLVLLQHAGTATPLPPGPDLADLSADLLLSIRDGDVGDLDRLARLLTGRATGLVLGGGGARGYSHIGVIKALHEVGMPIDLLGGASIGAIMAAGLAIGWRYDELHENIREAFVADNPVDDYTLPFVALTRGDKVTRRLQRYFGKLAFDQTWRPFYCVSSNLTTANVQVHRKGPLWRALRASIAIPGVLPPMIEHGDVLVDGGLMNNLPTDIMRDLDRGPVLGVDVGQVPALACELEDYREYPRWQALFGRRTGAPGIVSLLVRAATVSSEVYLRACREQTDLLFIPPVEHVELRAWKTLDHCVEAGYRHAMELLERHPDPWW
jgi:NTE family protein